MAKTDFVSIDQYIQSFPAPVQKILIELQAVIQSAAPEATEKISYQIPTFYLQGNLVHFAAYKNHIGFYPTPDGISEFQAELEVYKNAKGSVQFPIDQPLPWALIRRMVAFRVAKNLQKKSKQG